MDPLAGIDISRIPEYTGRYINITEITPEITQWCSKFHAANIQNQLAWVFGGLFIPMFLAIILFEWDNWPVFRKIVAIDEDMRMKICRYLIWFTVLAFCAYFIYFIWFDPFALTANIT